MKVFITGGAGYIGSHMVKLLVEKGYDVLSFDNLSTGHEWAVVNRKLVVGDLLNYKLLEEVLLEYKPDAVMHFAAKVVVPESVQKPLTYYENNFYGTLNLLQAMKRANTKFLIFSSTAAVYGIPEKVPIKEEDTTNPINPYGWSKLFSEQAIKDLSKAEGIKFGILRYFNVAGADPEGRIGQVSKNPTHLILRALKTAKGEFPYLEVYGTDYNTHDGTAVRDYIHVIDLCQAHLDVLRCLLEGGESDVFNVGYGRGYSVLEVVDAVKKITGIDFKTVSAPRRAGDPPMIVADPSKLKRTVGWAPKHDDLYYIIKTAWEWERSYIFKL
ncbi:UDP-glucose 4-epimerase GalE [Thermocrinis sp.]